MKRHKKPIQKSNLVSPRTTASTVTAPAAAAQPEVKEEMVLQLAGRELPIAEISTKVKEDYKEHGNDSEIKDIKIYIKPEDNKAYYVVNGEIEGNVDLV